MTTLAEKRAVIKAWLEDVTEYASDNVMYSYGGGPRPTGDFAMFGKFVFDAEYGQEFISDEQVDDVEGEITRTHTQLCVIRVDISVFSIDGAEVLQRLALSPGTFKHRKALADGDLVFVRKSPTIPIPMFSDTDTRYGDRANFYFSTQSDFVEVDYTLDTATATGSLVDVSGDEIPVEIEMEE